METMTVSPLDILLDPQNPRFIIPQGSNQEDLRLYLLEYEEIKSLANSIINYGGLMPGERIVVTKENEQLVVMEGNRRVCACQLLLNPSLIPEKFKNKIPLITNEVYLNINQIEVDFVASREATYNILTARHIHGIKRWETISKQKFFANLFEGGKDINEIKEITGEKDVKSKLQEYYLIKYALDLPVWSEKQKESDLNLINIAPEIFQRIIRSRGSKQKLGLTFDSETLAPKTSLPKETFDKALELIVRAAFITGEIDTRSKFENVPGLVELLEGNSFNEEKRPPTKRNDSEKQDNKSKETQKTSKESSKESPTDTSEETSSRKQSETPPAKVKPVESPPIFFGNLRCDVQPHDEYGSGILAVVKEVRNISKPTYLKQFPIAAAMLLRNLLEQTLKYHLKKMGKWDEILGRGDPGLQQLINYYNQNITILLPDKTMQRTFRAVFGSAALKDTLDLVVHHTDLVRIDDKVLESLSSAGIRAIIEYLLTYGYQN